MVRHRGHHNRRISPPLTSFYRGYGKEKVFSTPVPDITNLKARITDAFVTVTEDMLENTWREHLLYACCHTCYTLQLMHYPHFNP